jgi:Plavaka transposase
VDATPSNPWHPFPDRFAFEFADTHYTEQQSSESKINQALDFWLATTIRAGGDGDNIPWNTAKQMYKAIDSIKAGPVPWTTVRFRYTGALPPGTPPKWMCESYDLCFRDPRLVLLDQIASPDLHEHFDYIPYMQFNEKKDHVWSNLMSGSWAWQEAVNILIHNLNRFKLMFIRMIFFVIIHMPKEPCSSQS